MYRTYLMTQSSVSSDARTTGATTTTTTTTVSAASSSASATCYLQQHHFDDLKPLPIHDNLLVAFTMRVCEKIF